MEEQGHSGGGLSCLVSRPRYNVSLRVKPKRCNALLCSQVRFFRKTFSAISRKGLMRGGSKVIHERYCNRPSSPQVINGPRDSLSNYILEILVCISTRLIISKLISHYVLNFLTVVWRNIIVCKIIIIRLSYWIFIFLLTFILKKYYFLQNHFHYIFLPHFYPHYLFPHVRTQSLSKSISSKSQSSINL